MQYSIIYPIVHQRSGISALPGSVARRPISQVFSLWNLYKVVSAVANCEVFLYIVFVLAVFMCYDIITDQLFSF
jgi:hypothetical protein